jgi:hypothetical protein
MKSIKENEGQYLIFPSRQNDSNCLVSVTIVEKEIGLYWAYLIDRPGFPEGRLRAARDPQVLHISQKALMSIQGEQTMQLPGSTGEHQAQEEFGTTRRALTFYNKQMLPYLNPLMREFIGVRFF